MNLWMVNHHAITPDMPGGTRHFDLSRRLVKMGHEVTIIASSFHYSLLKEMRDYNGNWHLSEVHDGVNFVWMSTPAYAVNGMARIKNMLAFTQGFKKWAKLQNELPDVIIGSTVHPLAAITAGKFAKTHKIPFIFEIRDLWPQTMIDMGSWSKNHPASFFFKRVEKQTVKMAKAIIALSPLTKGYLKKEYAFEKTHLIPNGIDLEQFQFRSEQKELSISGLAQLDSIKERASFLAMFTGAIVKSNNMGLILDTAQLLRDQGHDDIHLALVGRGQEADKIKTQLQLRGLTNLHLVDPVPKTQVPHLLKRADALMLVQGMVLWGSMNKLFDYLASRRPVILAVEADHNAPIKKMDGCIPLAKNSPEEFAITLVKLRDMPALERNRIGNAGYQLVGDKHNIKQLASNLESTLKSVL